MDPSYDNFGSFNPDMGRMQPVVSEKKNNTRLIILLVFLILIGIGAGVFFLLKNIGNEDHKLNAVASSYNSYVNYVLFGKDSDSKIDLEIIEDTPPFFIDLQQNQRALYIEKANEKYNDLSNKYYESNGNLDLMPLKYVFQDYVLIVDVNEDDVLKQYLDGGEERASKYIDGFYNYSGMGNNLGVYLQNKKELEKLYLGVLVEMDAAGCIRNGAIVKDCYTVPEEKVLEISLLEKETREIIERLEYRAYSLLEELYLEIYNTEEGYEASINNQE